jgi:hypothetical protein
VLKSNYTDSCLGFGVDQCNDNLKLICSTLPDTCKCPQSLLAYKCDCP